MNFGVSQHRNDDLQRRVAQVEVKSEADEASRDLPALERPKTNGYGRMLRSSRQRHLSRGTRPLRPMILEFIDQMRAQGHAVESVVHVLWEQGLTSQSHWRPDK
jgi:hypothetical protein